MTLIYFRILLAYIMFIGITPVHAQWVKTNGPDSVTVLGNTWAIVTDVGADMIYAGAVGNVHLSIGNDWYPSQNFQVSSNDTVVLSIAMPGNNSASYVFAGMSGKGILRHGINYDFPWVAVNTGLTNLFVHALAVSGSNFYAGTENGIFLSTNLGMNWTFLGTGLAGQTVRAIAFNGTTILVGTNNGVFLSTNSGSNWALANNGLTTIDVRTLAVSGTSIYAGTEGGGVFRSTNNAANWSMVNSGLTNLNVHALTPSGQNVFAGTDSGVFLYTNSGTSWQPVSTGLTNFPVRALTITSSPDFLYAGTLDGTWRRPLSEMTTSVERFSADLPYHLSFGRNQSISFNVPIQSFVSLKVLDLSGRVLAVPFAEELPAGPHSSQLNMTAFPNGQYFCQFQSGAYIKTTKLLIIR